MADHEQVVKEFCDITGLPEDRAKFYLESANFELQLALSSYYENDDGGEEIPTQIEKLVSQGSTFDPEVSSDEDVVQKPTTKKDNKTPFPKEKPKITTLFNCNKDEDSGDSDEEQGQAFYAGGSDRSGQQVLGPPKKNPMKNFISEIFRSAQRGNMETYDADEGGENSRGSRRVFPGDGYRLGQTESDHVTIPGAGSSSNATPSNHQVVTLTLWRQGFSIDDGDLRRYEDPANKEFFECIMRGEIPKELRSNGSKMVHLDLKDNRHEEFTRSKVAFKAFGGSGYTLGSPAPNVISASSTPSTATPASSGSNEENEQRANTELNTNSSEPLTNIQVRLADGSRLTIRANHTHSVDDIRRFVTTARPQYATSNFALLTTFPSKELTDGGQSLKDAGLLNAAIMQRMK
uniref:Putative nsfl1 cofactor p47 n=1 Tax=Corethrella appendiculata TaxID=1370023 RepID=U5EYU9_9DIPT